MAPKIDSLELFAILLMCIEGKVDALCDNIITIFGWADTDKSLHRFEFHYFLDSLFRGILGLIITKGEQMPTKRGFRVSSKEIIKLVQAVFGEADSLDKEQFRAAI